MTEAIIDRRIKDLGGFSVGRVLPAARRRMIGPFVFFDHMGPADFPIGLSRSADVRPHPHIGLSTITYLFSGEIMHRDSIGSTQSIRAGEVNWMTAGSGITHSERFEKARAEGDTLHGIQTWIALPDGEEEIAPAFAHHAVADQPLFEEPGASGRLIAGSAFGRQAAARVHSPMVYVHWALAANATLGLPPEYSERAVYVASGAIEIGGQGIATGQMALLTSGDTAVIRAVADAVVMLIGGEPVGERFVDWNFVSSSRDRIAQAKADWRAGRMALPPDDHDEFIPLPPDPPSGPAAPNPMS